MHDFWIDSLTGSLSLHVQHGHKTAVFVRGQNTTCVHMPSIACHIPDFSVKLRVNGLSLKGESGTKVPNLTVAMLVAHRIPPDLLLFLCKQIHQLDLVVKMVLEV